MKYDLFVIDPPWPKKKGGHRKVRPNQGRELDYETLSVPEIFELLDREVFSLAADQHTVFLWVIDEFLHDAEQAMKERGYKKHARLVWDKGNGVAPCFTVRFSHEYLLWFYKPKLTPVAKDMRGKCLTVFRGQAREHSRKPDESYDILMKLFPDANKIDVFSREKREGWAQWGNEVNHFESVAA